MARASSSSPLIWSDCMPRPYRHPQAVLRMSQTSLESQNIRAGKGFSQKGVSMELAETLRLHSGEVSHSAGPWCGHCVPETSHLFYRSGFHRLTHNNQVCHKLTYKFKCLYINFIMEDIPFQRPDFSGLLSSVRVFGR